MDLLEQIEVFLANTGMSATAFGQKALNDPPFVQQLRDGRDPKMSTAARCQEFIASWSQPDTAEADAA